MSSSEALLRIDGNIDRYRFTSIDPDATAKSTSTVTSSSNIGTGAHVLADIDAADIDAGNSSHPAIDCSKLLSLAVKSEQTLFHFGHPPKPELQMYTYEFPDIHVTFLIAKTPHFICSQVIIDSDSRNSDPHVLVALEESSEITATCIVELEAFGNTRRVLVLVGSSTESSVSTLSSSSSSSQSYNTQQFSNHNNNMNTNTKSHFHVAEVRISPTGVTRIPPWQPIPTRSGFVDPKGITSIVSYDIHKIRYIWASYAGGTLLRLPAEALSYDFVGNVEPGAVLKVQTLLPDSNYGPYKIVPCKACPSMWMFSHKQEEYFSALVYPVSTASTGLGDPPTLMVYTAVFHNDDDDDEQNHAVDSSESELLSVALGATSTLLRTVSSVVQWGFSKQTKKTAPDPDPWDDDDETIPRFPQVYEPATIQLTAAYELHDAPRQIATLQVRNNYAVITDNFGRVQLLDLRNHFQVIRMWKGHRDATCVWSGGAIVIHSRQRRSLEAHPVPHGQRIASLQVSQEAEIIQCVTSNGHGSCYILGNDDGGATHLLTKLTIDDRSLLTSPSRASFSVMASVPDERSSPSTVASMASVSLPKRDTTLQMLRQMLDDTHVQCNKDDVFRTFTQISDLQQLCTALDLLCVSATLEERMGAKGSDFQEQCVLHGLSVLEKTIAGKGADITQSPPVLEFKSKLTLHAQLIDAYRILHKFETRRHSDMDDDTRTIPESSWAVEGIAWMQTYESVTQRSLSFETKAEPPFSFSSFCRCCNIPASMVTALHGKHVVQLSDSSRTRMRLLSHIFEPLLCDAFSFTTTNEIIDKMGFEAEACQLYLGNWYMSISAAKAASKSFFTLQPPISRWVQQLVVKQVDAYIAADQELPPVMLPELYNFCKQADDLVRAFWLATLCRDSVAKVVKKREVKTYGKVWKSKAAAPWEELLRKLRVCLLVSLRLYGVSLGPFPITVSNIEAGDIFSLYELVARDELSSSCVHAEIVSLETACKNSGFSFDPSSYLGDDPSRWKALQNACIASAISEEERAEYLVEFETDVQGALLLYLSQFNDPSILCAHRALLLAQKWIEQPNRIDHLRSCLNSLAALEDDEVAMAVRHEVWHTCIRPVFRAYLFGFDDVQEIQEDVFAPLMDGGGEWLVRMGKIGLSILLMMERPMAARTVQLPLSSTDGICWPRMTKDPALQKLVEKDRPVNHKAVCIHRIVMTGCMVSNDVTTLSECVGGFYDTFLSLQNPSAILNVDGDHDNQMAFLENAIIGRAEKLENVVLDRFELDEIESLALLWLVDVRDVRTIFLLAMYELGKDYVVSELLTHLSFHGSIDLTRFLEDGIGIVCRRLHQILHVKRSRETRTLLGLLDADTTEWIRTTAEEAVRLLEDDRGDRAVLDVPLQSTHSLVLRLLSIAAVNASKETRTKLHSLSVLSGTMLKELAVGDNCITFGSTGPPVNIHNGIG